MDLDIDELCQAILTSWILSEDVPEGDTWDDLCGQLGLDPDVLSVLVIKARKAYPRLKCGHYDKPENVYIQFSRKQCRTCKGARPPEVMYGE